MFAVGDRVADHVLEENLEHRARLLVDEAADAFDAAAASETANCRLRDALDVVAENLAMALGATFAEAYKMRVPMLLVARLAAHLCRPCRSPRVQTFSLRSTTSERLQLTMQTDE